jgi:hypothetical protein
MSGFERSSGREADALESLFPDDFSPDEIEFATEMRQFFAVEREDLPPLYVQTLLRNERCLPVPSGYERALTDRVFQRLRLSVEYVTTKRAVLLSRSSIVETIAQVSSFSRTAVATAGMVLMAMVMTVLLTSPSFAEGLQVLLGQTGVQQVSAYPDEGRISDVSQFSGAAVRNTFSPYWLGPTYGAYRYQALWTLAPESWSKGPIVEMQYELPQSANGSGLIDIREFQLSDRYAAVLQVVQAGAASQVKFDGTNAVYVDGAWQAQASRRSWGYGHRSELIFERNGVIFWIVGDPRSGADQESLLAVARQLTPSSALLRGAGSANVQMAGAELTGWLHNPSSGELYALLPQGVSADSSIDGLVLVHAHTATAMGGPVD